MKTKAPATGVPSVVKRVGGSLMVKIPKGYAGLLKIDEGSLVDVNIESGQMVVKPRTKPFYTLEQLIAGAPHAPTFSAEDREWLDAPTAGRELI